MGVKGSDITISQERRHPGVADDHRVRGIAEARRTCSTPAPTTATCRCRATGKSWTNVTDKIPNLPKGMWVSEVVPSRYDEGTVYATFDGHRQNDYETYIYVSKDFGQTWQSAAGNLKGESVKTLTEDQKNPDVIYIGTETGLFVSTDRAKSWTRIKANLPTVRIDEITLHPRDNAMVLATHGRAIWVLDHLEPIQEYAAAHAATTDARLFTPPPYAMYRRPARDRNYEFWGDQTFYGENPPAAAIISWINKKPVGEVELKITDAAGRDVREISGPVLEQNKGAGIQTACWDLRVQPAPAPPRGGRRGGPAGSDQATVRRRAGPPTRADAVRAPRRRRPSPFGAGCGGRRRRRRRRLRRRRRRPPGRSSRRQLQHRARRRRQDRGHENAARDRRSRRGADVGRAQADVRHGDGDARAAAARHGAWARARVADAAAHRADDDDRRAATTFRPT